MRWRIDGREKAYKRRELADDQIICHMIFFGIYLLQDKDVLPLSKWRISDVNQVIVSPFQPVFYS